MMENLKNLNDLVDEGKKIKVMTIEEIEKAWPTATPEEKNDILMYQNLTLDFITAHQSEIDFRLLSVGISLTEDVIDRFPKRVSWVNICGNGKPLSNRIMAKFINKIIWTLLLSHQQLDLEFLIRASEHMRKARYANKKDFWKAVSRYQEMDVVYVDNYKRLLDFKLMSVNPNISEEVLDKYLHHMDISMVIKSRELSDKFVSRYFNVLKPYFK